MLSIVMVLCPILTYISTIFNYPITILFLYGNNSGHSKWIMHRI